jgi:ABC-type nitrate/sulfonate/bicarbonate transport system ATPase subunit
MGDTLLRLKGIHFAYPPRLKGQSTTVVLSDISLEVQKGESVAIVGASGRGKTSLLRIMSGLQQPNQGDVFFRNAWLRGPTRGIGVVFQNYEETVFDWLTVYENIALAIPNPRPQDRIAVQEVATELGIEGVLDARSRYLSGGQRQRVAIARSLIQGAELLLMDEPFANLDALARSDLIRNVNRLTMEHGRTVVLVTHDIHDAIRSVSRVFCLLNPTKKPQLQRIPLSPTDTAHETYAQIITILSSDSLGHESVR